MQHLGELNSIRLDSIRFLDSIGFVSLKTYRRITISILNLILALAMKGMRVPTVPQKNDQKPKFLAENRRISRQYVTINFLFGKFPAVYFTSFVSPPQYQTQAIRLI